MSETFLTPQSKRLLWQIQLFLTLTGLFMLLTGLGRIAVEALGGLSDLASTASPELFTWYSFGIGVVLALVGYGSLYAAAAVGAREPPALSAIRTIFIAISGVFVATVIWLATVKLIYAAVALFATGLTIILILWLWRRVERHNLWQVFGQPVHRKRIGKLTFAGVFFIMLALLGVGVANAILTDRIELLLENPEPGELLYATTFDKFNDEWDLPGGTRKAEISDGELLLTLNSGKTDDGFYSLLETRKFRDFDLRVTARQISGPDDNSFGVVFRQRDADTYYVFEISGDGYYRLKKVEDNIATNITQWIESPVIQRGTAFNEIRVVAKGNTFRFYVNDELMPLCTKGESLQPTYNHITGECVSNEWEDAFKDESFKQGRIGLSVGNTATTDVTQAVVVAFDNLVIIGPEND